MLKSIRFFFRFSDSVIRGLLVWSDSVRTAPAVVIMYHVPFYSSTDKCCGSESDLCHCTSAELVMPHLAALRVRIQYPAAP